MTGQILDLENPPGTVFVHPPGSGKGFWKIKNKAMSLYTTEKKKNGMAPTKKKKENYNQQVVKMSKVMDKASKDKYEQQ